MITSREELESAIKKSVMPYIIKEIKLENGRWWVAARMIYPLKREDNVKWITVSDLINSVS